MDTLTLMSILVLLLLGVLARWFAGETKKGPRPDVSPGGARPRPRLPMSDEGIWARHPLDPDRGWCVAIKGDVPVDPGDEVLVTRRDGSQSFETVGRVLLELYDPDGDVVGRLVEVDHHHHIPVRGHDRFPASTSSA